MALATRPWGDPASEIVFSIDGQRMATHGNQTIRIWDAKNWKELHCLDQSKYLPRAMAFASDRNSLWHHHDGNEIYLWDVTSADPIGAVQLLDEDTSNNGKQSKTQENRYTFESNLTVSPNGRALVTKQTDGMSGYQFWGGVYALDLKTAKNTSQSVLSEASVETPGHLLTRIAFPRNFVSNAAPTIHNSHGMTVSPDSSHVSAFGRKDVLVIDASDPRNRRSFDYPEDSFSLGRSPAWSRAGNLLGTLGTNVGYARTIVQWNVETDDRTRLAPEIPSFRKQEPLSNSQDVLTCLDYSPDGRVLAAGNQVGNVILIDSGTDGGMEIGTPRYKLSRLWTMANESSPAIPRRFGFGRTLCKTKTWACRQMISKQRDRRSMAYTSATIMLIASVFALCAVARRIWLPFQDFDGIPLRAPVTLSLWDVLPHLASALLFVAGFFLQRKNLFHRSVQRRFEFAMPLIVIAGFIGAVIGVPMRLQDTVDYRFLWGLAFFCFAAGVMEVVFFVCG